MDEPDHRKQDAGHQEKPEDDTERRTSSGHARDLEQAARELLHVKGNVLARYEMSQASWERRRVALRAVGQHDCDGHQARTCHHRQAGCDRAFLDLPSAGEPHEEERRSEGGVARRAEERVGGGREADQSGHHDGSCSGGDPSGMACQKPAEEGSEQRRAEPGSAVVRLRRLGTQDEWRRRQPKGGREHRGEAAGQAARYPGEQQQSHDSHRVRRVQPKEPMKRQRTHCQVEPEVADLDDDRVAGLANQAD